MCCVCKQKPWLHNLLCGCHLENSQRKGKRFKMSENIKSDDTIIYEAPSEGDMAAKQVKTTSMLF